MSVPSDQVESGYYDWAPLPWRPVLKWPNDKTVALCVVVNLEHHALASQPLPRGFPDRVIDEIDSSPGVVPFPDIKGFTSIEYGSRIGIFRVMNALDKFGIKATLAIDSKFAENYPFIVAECKKRKWEFIGHGIEDAIRISEEVPEEVERKHIEGAIKGLERVIGERPLGWFAHDYGESSRTPALLAEQGVQYLLDWPNDEQPYKMHVYKMHVSTRTIISIPTMLDIEDTYALKHRRLMVWRWEQMVKAAFDQISKDAAENGRVFVLSLHPWLIGQAYRIRSLEEVLAHICTGSAVWKATGKEIAEFYLRSSA